MKLANRIDDDLRLVQPLARTRLMSRQSPESPRNKSRACTPCNSDFDCFEMSFGFDSPKPRRSGATPLPPLPRNLRSQPGSLGYQAYTPEALREHLEQASRAADAELDALRRAQTQRDLRAALGTAPPPVTRRSRLQEDVSMHP